MLCTKKKIWIILYYYYYYTWLLLTVIIYRTLGLTFMKMFQPKRPLRPRRKERKKIPAKSLSGQEIKVNIFINIIVTKVISYFSIIFHTRLLLMS